MEQLACISVLTKRLFPPLPYLLAQRVRKSVSGALRFLLLIEFMHVFMCTVNGKGWSGALSILSSLSRVEYTHHCGSRTLFITYNRRLSYSHVIWCKKRQSVLLFLYASESCKG